MQTADALPKRTTSVCGAWIGVLFLLLGLPAQVAMALDIITTDGHTYRDCTISKIEPAALGIIHSDGAATIPYEKLPPALQKQYFDPAKVAAYHEQIEEAKRVAAAKAEEDRLAAEARADEERRQRQIAAAEEEERREAEAEAGKQQAAEQKAVAQRKDAQDLADDHNRKMRLQQLMVVAAILGIFVYFLPSIIGWRKTNAAAIFVFNLFLGWTFVGWVAALVWACMQDSAMDILARQHLNRAQQPQPPFPPPRSYPEHEALPDREPYPARRALRDREGRYLE